MTDSGKKRRGRPAGRVRYGQIQTDVTQARRATWFGVSRDTMRRIDRLICLTPEFKAKLINRELTVHAAEVAAGFETPRFSVRHNPAWAAEIIHKRFTEDEVTELILELALRLAKEKAPDYLISLGSELEDWDLANQGD